MCRTILLTIFRQPFQEYPDLKWTWQALLVTKRFRPKRFWKILKGFREVVIRNGIAFNALECPARKAWPQVGKLLNVAQFLVWVNRSNERVMKRWLFQHISWKLWQLQQRQFHTNNMLRYLTRRNVDAIFCDKILGNSGKSRHFLMRELIAREIMPVVGMRNAILEMTSNERWGSCYTAHDGGCVQQTTDLQPRSHFWAL